eukprot:COSAG05_NODE_311_length_11636_cov_11.922250_21_plen_329_part_00
MKFGKQLSEARAFDDGRYVDYKALKKRIKSLADAEPREQTRTFVELLCAELDAVNAFFKAKEQAVSAQWREVGLAGALKDSVVSEDKAEVLRWLMDTAAPAELPAAAQPSPTQAHLRAFRRVYDDVQLLRHYVAINFVGFIKAMKKFEKNLALSVGHLFLPRLQRSSFFNSPKLAVFLAEVDCAAKDLFALLLQPPTDATRLALASGGLPEPEPEPEPQLPAGPAGPAGPAAAAYACHLCEAELHELPIVLACTHAFCWPCIASASAMASSEGEWACPSCCWPQTLDPQLYPLRPHSRTQHNIDTFVIYLRIHYRVHKWMADGAYWPR